MVYVIDTNIFLHASNDCFGFKTAPGFWDFLDEQLREETVVSQQFNATFHLHCMGWRGWETGVVQPGTTGQRRNLITVSYCLKEGQELWEPGPPQGHKAALAQSPARGIPVGHGRRFHPEDGQALTRVRQCRIAQGSAEQPALTLTLALL